MTLPDWCKKPFSGTFPYGSIAIFLFASAAGVTSLFKSDVSRSTAYWLTAGWLLACVAVASVTLYTAVAIQDGEERKGRLAERVRARVELSELGLREYSDIAQSLRDNQNIAAVGQQGDDARNALNAVLAKIAELAAEQKKNDGDLVLVYGARDPEVIFATLLMNIVVFIVSGLVTVSFWTAPGAREWGSGIMWCLCFLVSGGLGGFLFGIPRSRGMQMQNAAPAANAKAAKDASSESSPIEQIADWLTKTIVGLGLVNLTKIPGQLDRLGRYVSNSLCNSGGCSNNAAPSFAVGVIVYFGLVGFLSGYLLTQIFLTAYINRDPQPN